MRVLFGTFLVVSDRAWRSCGGWSEGVLWEVRVLLVIFDCVGEGWGVAYRVLPASPIGL